MRRPDARGLAPVGSPAGGDGALPGPWLYFETAPTEPRSPSSRGLGRRPFKAEARVRIPLGARDRRPGVLATTTYTRLWRSPESSSPCQGEDRGIEARQARYLSSGVHPAPLARASLPLSRCPRPPRAAAPSPRAGSAAGAKSGIGRRVSGSPYEGLGGRPLSSVCESHAAISISAATTWATYSNTPAIVTATSERRS
jgi:hypothetical protein